MCGNFCHLGHEHRSNYPNDRLEEAEEPGAQVPFREGLPEIEKKKRRKFFSQEKLKSIPSRKERKGELLCIEGDDKDGGDDLPAHGKPEHKDGVVNVAQLSVK